MNSVSELLVELKGNCTVLLCQTEAHLLAETHFSVFYGTSCFSGTWHIPTVDHRNCGKMRQSFYLLKWSFCINVLKYAVEGTQLLIVLLAGCFPSEWVVGVKNKDFYEVNCCTA